MRWLIDKVQVNIPFTMLVEGYLDLFIRERLNPEIGFDATALDRYGTADFAGISEQLHKQGLNITFHAPFMDLSPGSSDPQVRGVTKARFEQVLQLVPLFEPATVVCHASYDEKRYGYERDSWVDRSVEMWAWLGKRIRDEGSVLMLENVYEYGPDDMKILFERLAGVDVGFCLDTGHQAAFGRVPLEEWVKTLDPYLGQLHLHDNAGMKDEHMAMGKGKTDFRMLLGQLKAIREAPPVITLEPHKEEDLLPSLEYLEKIWPW